MDQTYESFGTVVRLRDGVRVLFDGRNVALEWNFSVSGMFTERKRFACCTLLAFEHRDGQSRVESR